MPFAGAAAALSCREGGVPSSEVDRCALMLRERSYPHPALRATFFRWEKEQL